MRTFAIAQLQVRLKGTDTVGTVVYGSARGLSRKGLRKVHLFSDMEVTGWPRDFEADDRMGRTGYGASPKW